MTRTADSRSAVGVEPVLRYVAELRRAVADEMLPWVEGPIFIADGLPSGRLVVLPVDDYRIYRVTEKLATQKPSISERFDLCEQVALALWSVEMSLRPSVSPSRLFRAGVKLGRLMTRINLGPCVLTRERRSKGGKNSGRWKNNPVAVRLAIEVYGSKIVAGQNRSAAIAAAQKALAAQFGKMPSESTVRGIVGLSR